MKKTRVSPTLAAGFLALMLLAGAAAPARASAVGKSITVYPGVSIYVEDQKLNPRDANGRTVEVFNYNGTVYLPVRAISQALDKPVQWVSGTRSVYVGKPSAAALGSAWAQQDSAMFDSTADALQNFSGMEQTGSTPSAVAIAVEKRITVYPGVTVYVDGRKLTPKDANGKAVDVFNYNGTVYLPVRAICEALDKPVYWDGRYRSVVVDKHPSVPNYVGAWRATNTSMKMWITVENGKYIIKAKTTDSSTDWREWDFECTRQQDGSLLSDWGGYSDRIIREDGSLGGGGAFFELVGGLRFDSRGRLLFTAGYPNTDVSIFNSTPVFIRA